MQHLRKILNLFAQASGKSHCIDCFMKALGIDISLANPTYTQTTFTEEEILDNHSSVLCPYSAILLGLPNAPRNLFPNY